MGSKDLVTVRIAKPADNDSIHRIKSVPRHGHMITQTGEPSGYWARADMP